jgi:uncharacterized protein RhaS with RHS repeats
MKPLIAAVIIAASAFARGLAAEAAGPVYDSEGRLTAYVYADGKQDTCKYDFSWRMTQFIDRLGNVTTFVYSADGSVKTLIPDGTRKSEASNNCRSTDLSLVRRRRL